VGAARRGIVDGVMEFPGKQSRVLRVLPRGEATYLRLNDGLIEVVRGDAVLFVFWFGH
jgi:hypothetical protein